MLEWAFDLATAVRDRNILPDHTALRIVGPPSRDASSTSSLPMYNIPFPPLTSWSSDQDIDSTVESDFHGVDNTMDVANETIGPADQEADL